MVKWGPFSKEFFLGVLLTIVNDINVSYVLGFLNSCLKAPVE